MKKRQKRPEDKKVRPKPKPILKWQTGEYDRQAEYKFYLPYQFLLVCKLMNVPPETVLINFMDTIDCGSWKREGGEIQRQLLIEYFIACGYGKEYYTEQDIRKSFEELDAIGKLWPKDAKMKLIDLHAKWRDKYHTYWFKKWFSKSRRKISQ